MKNLNNLQEEMLEHPTSFWDAYYNDVAVFPGFLPRPEDVVCKVIKSDSGDYEISICPF